MSEAGSDAAAGTAMADAESSDLGSDATEGMNKGNKQKEPQLTSRISVRQVVEMVNSFSEYKKWLVREIGFGGMLDLPMLQAINLKFSAWIMSKVNVHRRAIYLTDTKVLKFWAEDVGKVFQIPCGNRDVKGRDGDINDESIKFLKAMLGMGHAGAHSLKAAEEFLKREINELSSKLEKDCFQTAFVIFVMGHLLAPSTKYDYCTIDFWGALANTENIQQYNWCEYVLQCLLEATTKLHRDLKNGNGTVNLFGCHLFYQVFLLDNLELGICKTKHDLLPRIQYFESVKLRQAINHARNIGKTGRSYSYAPLRHPSNVCYTRSNFTESDTDKQVNILPLWISGASIAAPESPRQALIEGMPSVGQHPPSPRPALTEGMPSVGHHPPSPVHGRNIGANEYTNYLKNTYPDIVS